MNKDQIKKEFQENFLELRKLMNSWELIPGSPKDEFDSLNHQILNHLYKGTDFEKISRVLNSELTVTYGLSYDLEDSEKITTEIMEWWNFKNSYETE
ncbi:hypothetical protein [Aquimarina sp. AU119]|uniref:hypothetical protein n=1 Tax=Aquimarina sp. AU119 TaxID=2108528 RepID=UPI000D68AB32|nr:hypothetical protein [Aquimarina sp. AU119]